MDQKDKKEIIKIFGEILEQNVLPVLEEIRTELKKDINDVGEAVNISGRKLDNSIISNKEKFENHEKRILVLEGKR